MPDINASIQKIKEENPDQASTPVQPAGFFGKLLAGNAEATTSPWTGAVSYNQEKMNNLSAPEQENILTHELVHSRQIQQTPYINRLANFAKSMIPGMDESYYNRPREMEAYQAERDRNMRLGQQMPDPISGAKDIELPPVSPRRKIMAMFVNDRTK